MAKARVAVEVCDFRPESVLDGGSVVRGRDTVILGEVASLVVVALYGMDPDDAALRILTSHFPHGELIRLDSRELATHGGVLSCCTWTIRSPNDLSATCLTVCPIRYDNNYSDSFAGS